MTTFAALLISVPLLLFVYAYLGYPVVLQVLAAFRPAPRSFGDPPDWPTVTILLPAYNEAFSIRATLEALLALDYPGDRRQILVVSDASMDGTDDIVGEFSGRGVELLRQPRRAGKTAAENAAVPRFSGEIIVNTDATIRILPASLKPLIRVFQDPTIGAASGRDLSVGDVGAEVNQGESGYVGYEMWVRSLETRVGSIVGASGCFYAIRRSLVTPAFPEALSRDFASPLQARLLGYRTVSVDEARCLVPRTTSLRTEYRRKIRTMARGLDTLWYKRALLNPFRYGSFALMLWSHKLCRWLVHLTLPGLLVGLALLSATSLAAALTVLAIAFAMALGVVGMKWPEGRKAPAPIALCGFALAVNAAALRAWGKALRGERNPIWEPTRRPGAADASGPASG
ncbi:MAG TPA: glycosyltransferase family 2 protein [Gemmatimonadales bacterium]|nr:glycosyltransferase family 2 protein [Gemmatimonadales bacterium]